LEASIQDHTPIVWGLRNSRNKEVDISYTWKNEVLSDEIERQIKAMIRVM
jgi:hypothetical protein